MMEPASIHSDPNPFSTRFVRPGAISYQRLDGGTLQELVDAFYRRCSGWASIIGPHGSGKSTLIAGLKPLIEARSAVFAYRFSTTDREVQAMRSEFEKWRRNCVVIVDGYEQLSGWSRWRLRASVRRQKANLLISAHQPYRAFSVLIQTSVDEEQAICLRAELLRTRPDLMDATDLEAAWSDARRRYPTDLRETLMCMYDWAEEQKAKTARKS